MRLRIAAIAAKATERPAGYVEDVLHRGTIDGDWLDIAPEALADLREKYRPPAAEPSLPTLATRARNLAMQSAEELAAIAQGVPAIPAKESARRIEICRSNLCGKWRASDETCSICGCPMASKAPWRSARCPVGMW